MANQMVLIEEAELVKLIEQQKVANPPVQVTEEVRLKTPEGINQEIVFYPYLQANIGLLFKTPILQSKSLWMNDWASTSCEVLNKSFITTKNSLKSSTLNTPLLKELSGFFRIKGNTTSL